MNTPNCKHFDFAYEDYHGVRHYYCAVKGAKVDPKDCKKCEHREKKDGEKK